MSLGKFGSTDFNQPSGIAVDGRDGSVYVADTRNHRVVRLSATGAMLGVLPPPPSGYDSPRDVAVAPDGDLYVANTGKAEIVRYRMDGTLAGTWGRRGTGEGELYEPMSLRVVGKEVYVTDVFNDQVQVFGRDGRAVRNFPVTEWRHGSNEFRGIVVLDGRVYVGDPLGPAILVFSPTGAPLEAMRGDEIKGPAGLALSADGTLFVGNRLSGSVSQISLVPQGTAKVVGGARDGRPGE
jgi:DNA-binding beta-propeller fold protein YncE